MHPFKKMILSTVFTESVEVVPASYLIFTISSSSDDLTASDACSNQLDVSSSKYHNGELSDPIVGDIIFNDAEGLTVFNGNSEFWKFKKFGVGFGSVKINTIGVIIDRQDC